MELKAQEAQALGAGAVLRTYPVVFVGPVLPKTGSFPPSTCRLVLILSSFYPLLSLP